LGGVYTQFCGCVNFYMIAVSVVGDFSFRLGGEISLRATALSGPYFGGGFFYCGMSNIRQIPI
jgi:hypothetical protein